MFVYFPEIANAWLDTLLDVIDLLPKDIIKKEVSKICLFCFTETFIQQNFINMDSFPLLCFLFTEILLPPYSKFFSQ